MNTTEFIRKKPVIDLSYLTHDEYVYISGPATNVYNYDENFYSAYSFLIHHDKYKDRDILNPMSILSLVDDDYDYIDKVFITMDILRHCDTVILDDRTDDWKNSRGVLLELEYATLKYYNIISLSKLMNESEE